MWDCGKNCGWFRFGFFHNCTFPCLVFRVFFRGRSERWRIFSLFRVGSVGKKSLFSAREKLLEKLLAKSVGCGVFSKTEQRKAFCIIPNYRQKCGWLACNASAFGGGVEGNGLRWPLTIILIM